MSQKLQVLMVEDSEEDALLVLDTLRKGGFEPFYQRVFDAPAMSAALDGNAWDVVLCDFGMPSFDSFQALALVKSRALDIPFISVSGRIGEARAVELMKAGAHDYVNKDDLIALVPVIERELRAAEARQQQRQTEVALAHLAAIVESSDDAIISKTLDGIIVSWNKAAERIYGYTAAEMLGQSSSILLPPNRPDPLVEILEQIREGRPAVQYEGGRRCKDGRVIEVSVTISPIKARAGDIIGFSAIARDITAHKKDEAERLQLISELTEALANVKTLHGLLPICASCKKIRDDQGYWQQVETYIKGHSAADITHGICPECAKRLYPEYWASLEASKVSSPNPGEPG